METPAQELWLLNFLAVSAALSTRDLMSPRQRTGVDDQVVSTLPSYSVSKMFVPSYPAELEQPVLLSTMEEEQQ
jgi:hypothetical protein